MSIMFTGRFICWQSDLFCTRTTSERAIDFSLELPWFVSNSKYWFTASFLWRKVLESGARSVGLFLCVDALCCGNGAPRCTELGRRRSTTVGVVSAYSRQMHDE